MLHLLPDAEFLWQQAVPVSLFLIRFNQGTILSQFQS